MRNNQALACRGILICVLGMGGCAAPPQANQKSVNGHDAILMEDMAYQIGDTSERIIVPAGFVTDWASIPRPLWTFGLAPFGQYTRAAIIHDYLYWSHKCTRDQANRLLVIAMKESEVGAFDVGIIYGGVSAGGGSAWQSNADEKKKGLVRTLSPDWRKPADPNMSWPAYRKMLKDAGVPDATPPDNGSYCYLGDTMDVPKLSNQSVHRAEYGLRPNSPGLQRFAGP
jgi:hypothetical protein